MHHLELILLSLKTVLTILQIVRTLKPYGRPNGCKAYRRKR